MDRFIARLDGKRKAPGESIFFVREDEASAPAREPGKDVAKIRIDSFKGIQERFILHRFEALDPFEQRRSLPREDLFFLSPLQHTLFNTVVFLDSKHVHRPYLSHCSRCLGDSI